MPASGTRVKFEAACGQVGAGMADLGFRYLKSKRQAKQVVGEWTQAVPRFLDRVSESDLTFFNPGDVVDLLAAHGCSDQIGLYLRRLSGGLQSTGTVRTDGSAILAAARRRLAGETSHMIASGLIDALNRAESSHLLAEPSPGSGRS